MAKIFELEIGDIIYCVNEGIYQYEMTVSNVNESKALTDDKGLFNRRIKANGEVFLTTPTSFSLNRFFIKSKKVEQLKQMKEDIDLIKKSNLFKLNPNTLRKLAQEIKRKK